MERRGLGLAAVWRAKRHRARGEAIGSTFISPGSGDDHSEGVAPGLAAAYLCDVRTSAMSSMQASA
jgi:hypothetical protein